MARSWRHLYALALLCLALGCVSDRGTFSPPDDDDDDATSDDDDTTSDDDDTTGDDDDTTLLGPPGSIVGAVVDGASSEPFLATVHEHQSDPVNAVGTNSEGEFVLYPEVFGDGETTEFFAYDTAGNYIETFVALTRDAYLKGGRPLEVIAEAATGWAEEHLERFGVPWDPSLGLLVFEFDYLDIEDVEGTAVWLDAPHGPAFAYDSNGLLVESVEVPFASAKGQVIVTAVSPAPINVEVMPKAGIECLGPSGLDTLDNAVTYALYTCRPESP